MKHRVIMIADAVVTLPLCPVQACVVVWVVLMRGCSVPAIGIVAATLGTIFVIGYCVVITIVLVHVSGTGGGVEARGQE